MQAGTPGLIPRRPLVSVRTPTPWISRSTVAASTDFRRPGSDAPMEPMIELRCGDCGALFHLCRACYRGQRYCYDGCRRKARRRQERGANKRYRRSPEGRDGANDRKREQRTRDRERRAAVTHQGSAPPVASESVPTPPPTPRIEPEVVLADKESLPDATPPTPPSPRPPAPHPLQCRRCGLTSPWIIHRPPRRAHDPRYPRTIVSGVPP